MKEGWEMKKLKEVCRLVNGKAYKKAELLSEGKYPVLRVGNLFTNNKWYYSDLELHEDKYCDDEDLIYAWSASFGPRIWNGGKVIYHYHIWKVIPDFQLITRDYLFHLFEWDKEQIKSAHGTGTTMMHVGKGSMENRVLPIPPLPEQKQIVTLLDSAFAKIDQAKANIEKNIANAKELFQSKLNEIFSQKGDGWEEKTLIDISKEFGRGKSKHRPRNAEFLFGGKYPFVQTGEVRNAEKYITSYSKTYNEKGLAQSKLWKKGTICITIAANIAETAILDIDACFPDSIIGLIVDTEKATNDYSFYALMYLKSDLQAQGKGSAQDNINLGTFKKQLFPFPNIKTQNEIVKALDGLRTRTITITESYSKKIIALEELKKSLLQKAFAGELIQAAVTS